MFKVPESDAKKSENRFEFEVDGKKYSVPLLGFVSVEAGLLFEQGREIEGSLACFDDTEARSIYSGLNTDQRKAFEDSWVQASKVSPGESAGSAGS